MYVQALQRGSSAVEYVVAAVSAAEDNLAAFPYEPILTALKACPDGVCTTRFARVKYEGARLVEPKDLVKALEESAAIVYHLPSREYRLESRAHRTALLERWSPTLW